MCSTRCSEDYALFKLLTDTSANLPNDITSKYDIEIIPFNYYMNGEEHVCLDIGAFDGAAYYNAIRHGARATTSQVPPQRYIDHMRPLLEQGLDLLFIGMSSGISGSFSSAEIAARELREQYPDRSILLVDTFGASLGEGLLVMHAAEMRLSGADIHSVAAEISAMRNKMCQVFTVDDIMHLKNTGRLSNIAAVIGSILNIKPLLKGDGEGKIVCFQNVRGRRTAIKAMAAKYDELVENASNQTIGIAQADCAEDAAYLASLLNKNHPPREILTVCYEPVTGAHVGPGALALFFIGSSREEI